MYLRYLKVLISTLKYTEVHMFKNHVAKLHIGSKTIYFWIWNFNMVAKLLYYVGVNLDLVVATRKSFDVKSMYKSLFHRKCTV